MLSVFVVEKARMFEIFQNLVVEKEKAKKT